MLNATAKDAKVKDHHVISHQSINEEEKEEETPVAPEVVALRKVNTTYG